MMEATIKILIYVHAFFGGIGLITGIGNVILKNGNALHKKMGIIFSYSMVISSLLSLFIARMPDHENLFLFLIGIFTIYLVLSGNRALTLRSSKKLKADAIDKSISGIMFLTSLVMIGIGIMGILQKIDESVLYIFFGSFGVFMTLKDFRIFKTFTANKNAWIKSHIGRMVGALIAALTAFLVAGLNIGTTLVWITPTIIGTAYIIYTTRKFKTVVKSI